MAEFAYNDLRVSFLGRDIVGLQGLKYKKSVEKEYVYGRGSNPLSVQSGNKKIEGTVKILQSEFEALQAAIGSSFPGKDITDVQFDIVATYGEGLVAKTDIIQSVNITEFEKGLDQNDKFKVIELPFMALGILQGA